MLKRILFSVFALATMAVGAYCANDQLPPYITGANTENRRMLLDAGFMRVNNSNSALTAFATGGQASGTALNLGLNKFTTVTTTGDSATLPAIAGGVLCIVVNATTNSMNVFPNVGGTINALAANTALAVAAGKTVIFIQIPDGAWYALVSA